MTSSSKIRCTKFFFILFNFVFWLTGLALLVIGIWSRISLIKYMKLSTSIDYNMAPYIMIGCGSFIILVGFLGCWASLKEHPWALVLYMIILVLLFIAELSAGIAGYVLRNKLKTGLENGIRDAIEKYGYDTKGDIKKAVDDVQSKAFHCCGADSYKDWLKYGVVPDSCCKDTKNCKTKAASELYSEGCVSSMQKFFKNKFAIIGGTALGIAFFQILGVICAYCLARFIREVRSYEKF